MSFYKADVVVAVNIETRSVLVTIPFDGGTVSGSFDLDSAHDLIRRMTEACEVLKRLPGHGEKSP